MVERAINACGIRKIHQARQTLANAVW